MLGTKEVEDDDDEGSNQKKAELELLIAKERNG
jgi:hypothetical protein